MAQIHSTQWPVNQDAQETVLEWLPDSAKIVQVLDSSGGFYVVAAYDDTIEILHVFTVGAEWMIDCISRTEFAALAA